jgi:cytidine deaminase
MTLTRLITIALFGVLLMASTDMTTASEKGRREVVSGHLEAALAKLKPKTRELLTRSLGARTFRGKLEPDEVRALAAAEGCDEPSLIQALTAVAAAYAHPAVSRFWVGCACRGKTGAYYFGANIEVPGKPLAMSVHAEQAAIANAYNHREEGITALAVTAPPCGHCRQFLNELPGGESLDLILPGDKRLTLARLLPESFGPKELGHKGGPFGTPPAALALSVEPAGEAERRALDAARYGYAPYSLAPSGVTIVACGGSYAGSYIENAAFNPSLPPLQSALVGFLFGGEDFADITVVVLCEVDGASISQKDTTADVIKLLAPAAEVRHLLAKRLSK